MKKRILLAAICAAAFACAGTVLRVESVATADDITPSARFYGYTLALEDNIHIKYAVDFDGLTEEDHSGVLVWRTAQENYAFGTQDTALTVSYETLEENENAYPVYAFTNLSAKEMTDNVYAVAYVERGGEYYYSAVKKYSILEYAYNKLGKTEAEATEEEDLKALLNGMLAYGGAAQTYFDYKTETLASDAFAYVRVENATFADGFSYGLFKAGTEVVLTPDEGYELSENAPEYWTAGQNGEIILTVPTEKTVETTVMYKPVDTTFLDAYNGTYGYEYFGTQEKGEALQTLYKRIDKEVRAFHVDTTKDLTGDYTVATVAYSDLGLNSDEAASVWKTYKDDNPVYYWMSNSLAYTSETIFLRTVADYALGATRETYNQLVYDQVAAYKAKLDESDNAYQVAFGYHDMVIEAIDYTYDDNGEPSDEAWAHNILGVLTKTGGVCEAYARTYQLLLNYSGVENIFVTGESKDQGHAWNLVRLDDGNWYWYDLTWDDEGELGYTVTKNMGIYRNYFCKYGANLSEHTVWSDAPTVEDGEFKFMYDLPTPSTTAYADDTGLMLGETFAADDCTFTIVGYKALELNTTTKTGDVVLPETVAYQGADYTVVALGRDGNLSIGGNKTSVNIPKTVKFIWDGAFNIFTMQTISVDGDNQWFDSRDGVLFTENLYTLIKYPFANTRTEYVIPDETVYIAYQAFQFSNIEGDYLTKLTIGSNVREFGVKNGGAGYDDIGGIISGGVFDLSRFLTDEKLLIVADENEWYYQAEDSIIYHWYWKLGSSPSYQVVGAGRRDIKSCQILKEINGLPVDDFDVDEVLDYCEELENITVEEGSEYFSANGGILYNKETTEFVVVPRGIKEVTIPDSITSITGEIFQNHSSLTSVTLPDSVVNIGDWVFYNCSSLTSVTIGNGVTRIGSSMFQYCSSLTSVTLGSSVTSIESQAFYKCISLTSIIIPDGVTSIGRCAFSGCSSLMSITIPDSVKSIGEEAFEECSGLEKIYITDIKAWCDILGVKGLMDYGVDNKLFYLNKELITALIIPNDVTRIGDSAFRNCSSLTSVVIPNNVTSIGISAFRDCSSLMEIVVPDSVTSIGVAAFYGCNNLTTVYYKGTAEDWLDITIELYNDSLTNATVYYYTESEPTDTADSGKYWRYVDGIATVWTYDTTAGKWN